jgi:hypothetical protein
MIRRAIRAVIGGDRYAVLQVISGQWHATVAEAKRRREPEILPGYDYLLPTVAELEALHLREVGRTLSLGLQYVYNSGIEGEVVEFGTATGFSASVLASAMRYCELSKPEKTLHLFDSFTGLPPATSAVDKNAYEVRRGSWTEGACAGLSAPQLYAALSRLLPPQRVTMHEGWFKDTASTLPSSQRFAFIHFDGDMYQSTIDALGPLFARGQISKGAMICFDDWNCGQASPEHGERRAWRDLTERHRIVQSEWRSYSSMGKAFFIHGYRQ